MSYLQHYYSCLICCFDYLCPTIQIFSITDWCLFFYRLKKNHDSDEFNQKFDTAANCYIFRISNNCDYFLYKIDHNDLGGLTKCILHNNNEIYIYVYVHIL
jgi:hypothetical protein